MPYSPPNQLLPIQPVVTGDTVTNFHNINVTGGNFGIINTGQLSALDLSVGYLKDQGQPQLASAIQALTEGITKSRTVAEADQAELVELLGAIAEEVSKPKGERRVRSTLRLATTLATLVSGYADLASLWAKHGPTILGGLSP